MQAEMARLRTFSSWASTLSMKGAGLRGIQSKGGGEAMGGEAEAVRIGGIVEMATAVESRGMDAGSGKLASTATSAMSDELLLAASWAAAAATAAISHVEMVLPHREVPCAA